MGKYLLLLALAAAFPATADEEFSTARVVDVGRATQLQADTFGGVTNANVNTITVDVDGMRVTANYQTLLAGGRNSASRFIVGSEVQARLEERRNGAFLWIVREDGKPVRFPVVRREILRTD